jgi:DNA-directed RNA polymerase specialized sigma24 family protein
MKSEVYSWRLSPRLKAELEEAARAEQKSMAELLEQIAQDWLRRARDQAGSDDDRQQRLHEAALKAIGTIESGRTDRAENARIELRSRIARQHAR